MLVGPLVGAALMALGSVAYSGGVTPPVRTFPIGQIVENVQSDSNPEQRFALYLPTGFDPAKPTPVLFIMDPRRRALVPLKLFKPAAERFGYVIVSSYNTASDEPAQPSLRALQAMWTDMHDWFTVDDRRVYLAGFSGTARMAWLLARHLSGTFTGVIGAGAGSHPEYPPTKDFKFQYFATVGTVDYNFYELQRLEERLATVGLFHRIEGFGGPHSWMPEPLATQAIEWMELQGMRTGVRAADGALVDEWWRRDEVMAQTWTDMGLPLKASWRYAAMARDYAGLRETAEVEARARELGSSPKAKLELERRQRAYKLNALWTERAMMVISEAFEPGAEAPALSSEELIRELEVKELRKAAASTDPVAAIEARQRLNSIEVQLGFYLPRDAISHAEYVRANYYLDVAVQMDDTSSVSWYLMAVAHARLRDPREAAEALERAIDTGYRNVAEFEAERAFRNVEKYPAFIAAVERLRAVSAVR
jgi:tetratricopeptide (TPR) repeat protein